MMERQKVNEEEIERARKELALIDKQKEGDENLQMMDEVRDEYLRIKSMVEQDNAQIGRQMGLLE